MSLSEFTSHCKTRHARVFKGIESFLQYINGNKEVGDPPPRPGELLRNEDIVNVEDPTLNPASSGGNKDGTSNVRLELDDTISIHDVNVGYNGFPIIGSENIQSNRAAPIRANVVNMGAYASMLVGHRPTDKVTQAIEANRKDVPSLEGIITKCGGRGPNDQHLITVNIMGEAKDPNWIIEH